MVDTIIVLKDGMISEMGSYQELLSHSGSFAQFLQEYLIQVESSDEGDPESKFVSFYDSEFDGNSTGT